MSAANPGSPSGLADVAPALLAALGARAVVLTLGHGAAMGGPDLRQGMFCAIYMKQNAEPQAEALKAGRPVYLSATDGITAATNIGGQIDRPWGLRRRAAWA